MRRGVLLCASVGRRWHVCLPLHQRPSRCPIFGEAAAAEGGMTYCGRVDTAGVSGALRQYIMLHIAVGKSPQAWAPQGRTKVAHFGMSRQGHLRARCVVVG
jgi:hypothetical protein